ncbi:cytochrome b [Sinorhizobium sp. 8-89]|uniref:cytochrome b n=1 Tax=Sinorhizobium sp. 7-81 TaxID=3049087 RepID=UPI0024C437E6|nr:cytochrome b [Sinorhizobium sp. 7-81]MDK1388065.1 cytochrome b [Sinorhizobium sp. 7-81]
MLRNSETRFGLVTIVLHWTIGLLILGLLLLGFIMRRTGVDPALQFALYQWHKSFGFAALGLALIRAIWWLVERTPSPPASVSPLERKAARLTHDILIVLGIVVPFTGWAVASASTLNIPSFFFNMIVIPHLPLARSETSENFWTFAHALLAYVAMALIAIHAAAAFYHHFKRGDEVLTRMLRPGVRPVGAGSGGTSARKRDDAAVGRK